MAKYKIVHYLNQFFAGIGGEDRADYKPEVREEVLGPGLALPGLLCQILALEGLSQMVHLPFS